MKILIVNLHSSHNAGDDVLTRVTVGLLKKQFPQAEIILAMNDPQSYQGEETVLGSFMVWFKPNGRFHPLTFPAGLLMSLWIIIGYRLIGPSILKTVPLKYRALPTAYFEADMVVSSAGNFLYSSGALGLAFLISVYISAYAWWAQKPLYTMPQTFGPFQKPWEPWIMRWFVKHVRLLFVREAVSKHALQQLGAWQKHCYLVPDVAFLFAELPKVPGKDFLGAYGVDIEQQRPLLGVTLINWQAIQRQFSMGEQKAYETAVAQAIAYFVEALNGTAILFSQVRGPSVHDDDRIPAQRVKHQLNALGERVVFIDQKEVAAETLKSAYGEMDIFIGSRLHSNIFALIENTPALLIAYQYKTVGIVQMMQLDEWTLLIEEAAGNNVVTMLKTLWSEKERVKGHIAQEIKNRQLELGQMLAKIEEDFQRG